MLSKKSNTHTHTLTHFARLSSGTDWESGEYNSKLICEVELKFNERFREKGIHVFCKRVAKREREREEEVARGARGRKERSTRKRGREDRHRERGGVP